MKTFPMFLKMEQRSVVIIGGGEEAAQKCRLMLKTEANVTLVADELEPELCEYLKKVVSPNTLWSCPKVCSRTLRSFSWPPAARALMRHGIAWPKVRELWST